MSLTAKQFADIMPDATQIESDEPEMESSIKLSRVIKQHRSHIPLCPFCAKRLL